MNELGEWDSFYVIVGSAGGALIGLQFVVLTLIAERPPAHGAEAGAAFATPTIVHFSVVLLLSALVRMPWHTVAPVAASLGLVAFLGLGYVAIVVRRMLRQDVYRPELEDWCFHVLLPLAAYAILAWATIVSAAHLREALFGVGVASLLLLFIGIHNAWDAIVYHAFGDSDRPKSGQP